MQQEDKRFEISLRPLAKHALPFMGGAALFGAIPTWLLSGWLGIIGEAIAVLGVMLVMLGSAKMVRIAADSGVREACLTFLGASVVRAVACPAVVILIGWATKLPFEPMIIWLAICYVACLFMECIWVVVALKRHHAKNKINKKNIKKSVQPNYMDWSI